MRSVNIAELKDRLSAYITIAKAGEEVVIRDRNLPVAKLVPFPAGDVSSEDQILVAAGKMRLPITPLHLEEFWKIKVGTVKASGAVSALLSEREEGM